MNQKTVTVNLMGGLGNQMFQYAAGRALAIRNDARLYVDAISGFVRDKVYRRTFELGAFPIEADQAGALRRVPFWLTRIADRFTNPTRAAREPHLWGTFVRETEPRYLDEVFRSTAFTNAWMYGYWQSEQYFADAREAIARELTPPAPRERQFIEMARTIAGCNSVAVGVRLFEEVPGASKVGVGGLTPISFYSEAMHEIARTVPDPVFFVFCTNQAAQLKQIEYPGPVHFITHDNGFNGSLARLWLISQCVHHVLSNSSFYWWAAWLAERREPRARIIASNLYSNRDTVPERWRSVEG